MPTSCGNCASIRPISDNGFTAYCSTLLTFRDVRPPTLDCPHWSSDAEVRAELLGEDHHNPATCGQCVCYNPRSIVTQDGTRITNERIGSCSPVGERAPGARACHRFFPNTQLHIKAPGWPV